MRLNKTTLYILVYLLNGCTSASEIAQKMPSLTTRSIQRSLERLMELGLIERIGPSNNPTYAVRYHSLVMARLPEGILEDVDRPESSFNHALIDWLHEVPVNQLEQTLGASRAVATENKISAKELEYLTVELSWKSSALEGNTYTLLDTQLLLTEGIKAKGRTDFETQMVLNHKNAIGFIIENPDLFSGKINYATIEELHRVIVHNLGIPSGIRKKLVKISASNYIPPTNPHQLRESADKILEVLGRFTDPIQRSLMALCLIPYLQAFEDGNKRTGRMLANAILISAIGKGFSLRKVSARELALAYLSFYEFNSIRSLAEILHAELETNTMLSSHVALPPQKQKDVTKVSYTVEGIN
jgi:Fic family protein